MLYIVVYFFMALASMLAGPSLLIGNLPENAWIIGVGLGIGHHCRGLLNLPALKLAAEGVEE
jgi:hypothetical protein